MVKVLKKESSRDFDETVQHVEKILKEEGFSILNIKALDAILKQKFALETYPRYTIILACAPELAKMALEASLQVGTLFPCSFVVYEEEDKVIIGHTSIMKIAAETALATEEAMAPVIEATGKKVQAVWAHL